jgi:DNA repair exonuclease SbcCD ATPase subunit
LNRDIYQMAMSYQRKVNEFDTLLGDYQRDSAHLASQIGSLEVDMATHDTFIMLESERAEAFKEAIQAAKEKVKVLQGQRDAKDAAGEEIYNNLRDHISVQEERLKAGSDEVTPIKNGSVPLAQQMRQESLQELQYLKLSQSQNDLHKIAAEILTAEKEREKCNDSRDKNRDALEKVKRKLPINLEVDALSPKNLKSNSL